MSDAPSPEATTRALRTQRLVTALLLLVVLAFAAHLRLRAAHETIVWPPLQGDSVKYVSMAYNLDQYGIFSVERTWTKADLPPPPAPTALTPPGYPWLLSLVLDGKPDQAFHARTLLLQAGLGILAVLLGWLLARTVLPRAPALVVALLLAVTPQLVTLGTSLLTEVTFTVTLAAFAGALAVAGMREQLRWYALSGVLLGACTLVRPTLQYLPLLLLPAIAWLATRDRWKACGVLLLAYALTFGPWLVRNRLVLGSGGDPTLMASTLLHGSYPDFKYEGRPETEGFPYRYDPAAKAIRTPRQALARVGGNFAADPVGSLRWYLVGKPLRFHEWGFVEGAGDVFINSVKDSPYFRRPEFVATHALLRWVHPVLMGLSLLGLALALVRVARRDVEPRARAMGLLAVTMLFAIALHMVGLPLARYAVPFRPLTYIFALEALLVLHAAVRRRWQ